MLSLYIYTERGYCRGLQLGVALLGPTIGHLLSTAPLNHCNGGTARAITGSDAYVFFFVSPYSSLDSYLVYT